MRSISQAIVFLAGVHLCIAAAFNWEYRPALATAGIGICSLVFVVWLYDMNAPDRSRRDSSPDKGDDSPS